MICVVQHVEMWLVQLNNGAFPFDFDSFDSNRPI